MSCPDIEDKDILRYRMSDKDISICVGETDKDKIGLRTYNNQLYTLDRRDIIEMANHLGMDVSYMLDTGITWNYYANGDES